MGCGATKVQVKEEEKFLSSEDKTDDCRFFCPLCMLFYERKPAEWPVRLGCISTCQYRCSAVRLCRNAEGQLLRPVHLHWMCNIVHERCAQPHLDASG